MSVGEAPPTPSGFRLSAREVLSQPDGGDTHHLVIANDQGAHEAEVEAAQATGVDRLRARLLDSEALDRLPPPEPLIDGILMRDTLTVVYGKPGSSKSLLTLDWGISIGVGAWWMGHSVRQGPVLYVAAEGSAGLGQRKRAWQVSRNIPVIDSVLWLPEAVNLMDARASGDLAELVAELRPVFVVIDTLSRSLVGGDENTARDMGIAVERADRLRAETGTTVALVHHTTKEGGTVRGSSALEGAVDTAIEVKAEGKNVVLTCQKQKDAEPFPPIRLRRVAVEDSVVLQSHDARGTDDELWDSEVRLLVVLRDSCGTTGASSKDLLELSELPKSTYYRGLNSLLARGLVANTGSQSRPHYRLSENGQGS